MEIYKKRPFKTRNADEYDLNEILELFVNPLIGYNNPFEYENNIIKGKMGSGKTMYLKANYVFYLYSIIPSLINNTELYLPVFLKLNDFQHEKKPENIYRMVIVSIIEHISKIYIDLQNCRKMAAIHKGMQSLSPDLFKIQKFDLVMRKITKMTSEEYVQTIKTNFETKGSITAKFLDLSSRFEKEEGVKLIHKPNPGIADVKSIYEYLLQKYNGKILILIDEAGALDKSFFRSSAGTTSFFEILMNQLRTSDFIRTKIAVYPYSYSDILAETRYGDVVMLEENIVDDTGYQSFRSKTIELINNYLSNAAGKRIKANGVFDIEMNAKGNGDCLEQIINASDGNLRRLVQLLDLSMMVASEENSKDKVKLHHAINALNKQARNMEVKYTAPDKDFLENIAKVCRKRGSYRFKFPYKAPILSKYLFKSEEQNLLQVVETGAGRRGTTYAFDYGYCVFNDIPTHFLKRSERIDKERSRRTGNWINRIVQISEEIIQQAEVPGKIEGEITFVHKDSAFVKGDDGEEYFVSKNNVIRDDQSKPFSIGRRLRFYPANIQGTVLALKVEIL